jgi:hypothetical protein
MELRTRASGAKISSMAWVSKLGPMARPTRVATSTAKKHGKGLFTWADGSRYEGDFHDNNIEGHGVYNWSD